MKKLVLIVGLAAGAVALTTALAIVTRANASPPEDLQAAKAASARYHSVQQAIADGYSGAGEPCVVSPGAPAPPGAMGIHYANQALVRDPAIDPEKPEILLYEPGDDGTLTLVGVEYMKVDADQDLATDGDRPSIFGVPFDGPMPGHNPTMPIHYDRHVWLWRDNPNGMFAPFNSAVTCP
jgi:hypothetical protein